MRILLMALSINLSISCMAQPLIDITEQTIKIGRMNEEEMYFGFAAGDQVIFSFEETSGKELKEVEVVEHPSTAKFSDFKTAKITGKRFIITKAAIYKFRFHNSSVWGREGYAV